MLALELKLLNPVTHREVVLILPVPKSAELEAAIRRGGLQMTIPSFVNAPHLEGLNVEFTPDAAEMIRVFLEDESPVFKTLKRAVSGTSRKKKQARKPRGKIKK